MSEDLSVHDLESPEQKAIRLLDRQLKELQLIRFGPGMPPSFPAWHDTTKLILDKFLGPESNHTVTFKNTSFTNPQVITDTLNGTARPPGYVSPEDISAFFEGCNRFDATLKAAITHVEDFGVYIEQPKLTLTPTPASVQKRREDSGGVSQTFHGPVYINQAIATDQAIQKIGHIGNETGTSLKEIAALLQRSEELSPRQVNEGLTHIEAVAAEVQKPEAKRDWKTLLERGKSILEVAGKATDLAHKLAPYTSTVAALIDKGQHFVR
jgi:hypothetical protein